MNKDNSKIRDLSGLPRELAPPRDLWPGIAAQIGMGGRVDRQPPARPPLGWTLALAAGLAALVLGVLLGRWSAPAPGSLQADAKNNGLPAAGMFFDAAFVADRNQLRSRVTTRIRALPAEQRDQLLASVSSLQRAVEEIQQALGADPANALLQELLVGACQQEMTQLNEISQLESRL